MTFKLVFLLVLLCGMSCCKTTYLSLTAGEPAEILFQYSFLPDVDIQLRIGNRPSFYKSGNIDKIGLSKSQIPRYKVTVEHQNPYNICIIRIDITIVQSEDAGTYICEMYRDGGKLASYTKKTGLNVEFPPEKAFCRERNYGVDNSNVWALMECYAMVGTQLGQIQCYQSGKRMPPFNEPFRNDTTMVQTMWIEKTIRSFCCTSTYEKPKSRCNCHDFIWDPVTRTVMNSTLDPCPGVIRDSDGIKPEKDSTLDPTTPSNMNMATTVKTGGMSTNNDPCSCLSQPSTHLHGITYFNTCLLIILIILLIMVYKNNKN